MTAPLPAARFAQSAPLSIIHADQALVMVEKPSGLLSVPAKPPGCQDCVEARLRSTFPSIRLVHRLDLETSGVMVFALTALAQRHLNWQFERRQVKKTYVAHVHGVIEGDTGTIDLPLACDWPNRPRQMVSASGRAAFTAWRVIGREEGITRLELSPLTGRSHQLRVHLAAIGHPILGDPFYAGQAARDGSPRLALHAKSLGFRHPIGGAWAEFSSPVPF